MTNTSTKLTEQTPATNQDELDISGNLGSLQGIVDSLLSAIDSLQPREKFGAFFLVVALIATAIFTWSLDSNNHKFWLGITFLLVLSLFVIVIYAFNVYQSKTGSKIFERAQLAMKSDLDDLNNRISQQIERLDSFRSGLSNAQASIAALPPGKEKEALKSQIEDLLGMVESEWSQYSQDEIELVETKKLEEKINTDYAPERYEKYFQK